MLQIIIKDRSLAVLTDSDRELTRSVDLSDLCDKARYPQSGDDWTIERQVSPVRRSELPSLNCIADRLAKDERDQPLEEDVDRAFEHIRL